MQSRLVSRRAVLAGGATLGTASLLQPAPLLSESARLIPQKPSARVIVDNDFAGDPDGLVALAHQLLAPKTVVSLITSSALNPEFSAGTPMAGHTAEEGRKKAAELIRRARIAGNVPIEAGSETFETGPSAAARAIVREALRQNPLPLFLTCGGPLTNVAAALRLEPAIARRMTVIWIGGGPEPDGGWEYNLVTDIAAARFVIEESGVPLWQIPQDAYRQMQYSIAEMTEEMRPISPFSQWLYDQFTDVPAFVDLGGTWPLGDSPLVLLTALSRESSISVERPARRVLSDGRYGAQVPGRMVRVYRQLDARLTFGDFIARLRLHAAQYLEAVR